MISEGSSRLVILSSFPFFSLFGMSLVIVGSFETSFDPLWVLIFWLGLWLGELDSLVKVFRLLRLEQIVLGVQSVDTVGKCITSYQLAGPACL